MNSSIDLVGSYIIPLMVLVYFANTISICIKRKFNETIAIALVLISFILFPFGFFYRLDWGMYLILAVAGIGFVLSCALSILKRRTLMFSFTKDLGFWIFLTVYTLIFIINYSRYFSVWDEYIWGGKVKLMYSLDGFYSLYSGKQIVHCDYPPALQLVEYFWIKLVGGYQENYLYMSLQTCLLSLFIPFFCYESVDDNVSGNFPNYSILHQKQLIEKILFCMLSAAGIMLVPLVVKCGEAGFYYSIYQDASLAIITLSVMLYIYRGWINDFSPYDYFRIFLLCSFLTLTKQMGAPLALMSITFLFLVLFEKGIKKNNSNNHILPYLLSGCIISFVPYLIWNRHIKNRGLSGQFEVANIDLSLFMHILRRDGGESWQQDALVNFLENLIKSPITTKPFECSYFTAVLLMIVVVLLLGLFLKDRLRRIFLLETVLIMGAVGYAFVMAVLYMFGFSDYEATNLASYDRYMSTYILFAWGFVILQMIITIIVKYKNHIKKQIAILGVFVCALIGLFNTREDFSKIIEGTNMLNPYEKYEESISLIENNTEQEARVFSIVQGSNGLENTVMRYLALPRIISGGSYGKPYSEGDVWTYDIPCDRFAILLMERGEEYLLFFHVDQQFIDAYGELFDEIPVVMDNQLFVLEYDSEQGIHIKELHR